MVLRCRQLALEYACLVSILSETLVGVRVDRRFVYLRRGKLNRVLRGSDAPFMDCVFLIDLHRIVRGMRAGGNIAHANHADAECVVAVGNRGRG